MNALRGLAGLQAAVIVVLLVLVWRGAETAVPAAPPPSGSLPASAPPPRLEAVPLPAAAPPTVTAPVSEAAPAPPAPLGTVLLGRVVDAAGEPVRGAHVSFWRVGGKEPLASFATHLRPEFAVAGFEPGPLEVQARATGYTDLRETIDVPVDTPWLRRDIVLAKAWILAVKIVTADGTPMHEALRALHAARPALQWVDIGALATLAQPSGDFPPTDNREARNGVGRWRSATGFEGMTEGPRVGKGFAGVLELGERQSLWISAVLRHRLLASARVEPGQEEVTLTVALEAVLQSLCTVRVRVVDGTTGAPVAGAEVSLTDAQTGSRGERTDAEGNVELRDLRPGLLGLSISAGDRYTGGHVELQPGQVLDLGALAVSPYRVIEGRCQGLPAATGELSVYVWSVDPPPHPALRGGSFNARVADDGTFKLRLHDGRYLVRATGRGGAIAQLDTRALGARPLILPLAAEVDLRLSVKTRGADYKLRIYDAAGNLLWGQWLVDGWRFPIQLLPGDYRLEITGPDGKVATRALKLGAAGADLVIP